MRICVHRGTNEIGGTCVEIESQGKRIVLDVGLPLDVVDPGKFPLHPVKGFDKPDPNLLGVLISHPHQDHYGLAHRLPEETLFLIGKAAQNILAAAEVFSPSGLRLANARHLEDRKPMALGPFTITPYLMDHSAYDAYAVQVEADGAGLFYSGDLRAHGRKGKLFEKFLRLPPKSVDLLLMEGTTIGRCGKGFETEEELENRFVELFKQTKGMALIWCSGQNIDRLVSIYKACVRSGRTFVVDMYTAHILRATGNRRLPQAGWEKIRVFLPFFQKRRIQRKQAFDVAEEYKSWRIYPESLASAASHSVMLFRPTMIEDIERANCFDGARLIYSMWSGYLMQDAQKPLQEWLKKRCIPLDECHTSGHATVQDLARLRGKFAKAPVVPIHSEYPDRFEELFGNVRRVKDGVWMEVRSNERYPTELQGK